MFAHLRLGGVHLPRARSGDPLLSGTGLRFSNVGLQTMAELSSWWRIYRRDGVARADNSARLRSRPIASANSPRWTGEAGGSRASSRSFHGRADSTMSGQPRP